MQSTLIKYFNKKRNITILSCKNLILWLINIILSLNSYAQTTTFEKRYDIGGCSGISGVVELENGNLLLATGKSITFNYSLWAMMETDAMGEMNWIKYYGEQIPLSRGHQKLIQTGENEFYTAGTLLNLNGNQTDRGFVLIKWDANGDTIWTRFYNPGPQLDVLSDYTYCEADEQIILIGKKQNYGIDYDSTTGYIIKTDNQGGVIWEKEIRTLDGERIDLKKIIVDNTEGGYFVLGEAFITPTRAGTVLMKLNSEGEMLWYETYIVDIETDLELVAQVKAGEDFIQLPNGDIIVTGYASVLFEELNNFVYNTFIMHLSNEGEIISEYQNNDEIENNSWSLAYNEINKLVVLGIVNLNSVNSPNNSLDTKLEVFDLNLSKIFEKTYGGSNEDEAIGLKILNNNDILLYGASTTDCTCCNYLIRVDKNGCFEPGCETTGVSKNVELQSFRIFPNPANDIIHLQYNILIAQSASIGMSDLLGRSIIVSEKEILQQGNHTLSLSASKLPDGLYVMSIKDENGKLLFRDKIIIKK